MVTRSLVRALTSSLLAAQLGACQWLGGFDEFSGASEANASACAALMPVKEDDAGLGLMSRVDIPNSECFWIDQEEVSVANYQRWQSAVAADAVSWDPTWMSCGGGAPRLLLWPEVAVPVPFQAIEPGTKSPPVTLPAAAQAAAYLRPGDILVTWGWSPIPAGKSSARPTA